MDTSTIDLLALIGRDVPLRRTAATGGGEYAGACPFCGGHDKRDADRFHVWPAEGRYWCRRCERTGDAIQYLREREGLTFVQALDRLGLQSDFGAAHPSTAPGSLPRLRSGCSAASESQLETLRPRHEPAAPPSDAWQARAVAFCMKAEDQLWAPEGAEALAWLRDVRGLTDETIRLASLGYNADDLREAPEDWGLAGDHKAVWLPRGVVIPWVAGGHLWRVNIRRPAGAPKYIGPAGWRDALYRADALAPAAPAVLVEGELDALTIAQYAGGLAAAAATGSTMGARRARWLARLALCGTVLVAFDGDAAGDEAARYWLDVLANGRRWRAFYGKDANGQAAAGGDVRGWVLAGLEQGTDPESRLQPVSADNERNRLKPRFLNS